MKCDWETTYGVRVGGVVGVDTATQGSDCHVVRQCPPWIDVDQAVVLNDLQVVVVDWFLLITAQEDSLQ